MKKQCDLSQNVNCESLINTEYQRKTSESEEDYEEYQNDVLGQDSSDEYD